MENLTPLISLAGYWTGSSGDLDMCGAGDDNAAIDLVNGGVNTVVVSDSCEQISPSKLRGASRWRWLGMSWKVRDTPWLDLNSE